MKAIWDTGGDLVEQSGVQEGRQQEQVPNCTGQITSCWRRVKEQQLLHVGQMRGQGAADVHLVQKTSLMQKASILGLLESGTMRLAGSRYGRRREVLRELIVGCLL